MSGRMSLLELCVRRAGGARKGARVGAFIAAWGICRDDLGRLPTVEEYAEYWKQSRASGYREQQRFRAAFPEFETPDAILDHIARQRGGEVVDVDQLRVA